MSTHLDYEVSANWVPDVQRPALIALIEEGLQNNPQLQIQTAQVEEIIQQVIISGGDRFPELAAFFRAAKRDNGSSNESYSLGVTFAWELDIWGKLDDRTQAATLDAAASKENWRQAKLGLIADIAGQWFLLLEEKQQLQLIEQRRKNLKQHLIIIEEGYLLGVNSSLDFYLARADYAATEARVENRLQQLLRASRNLEILLGRYPRGKLMASGSLPREMTAIPSGIPSDILKRRPDLLAAGHQLGAANLRLAEAYKNRFPSLQLTADYGTSSEKLRNLIDTESIIWSLVGGLTTPLFDAGKLAARQEQSAARATQKAASYTDILLNAFIEVENGLDREEKLHSQQLSLERAGADSNHARELAFEQYRHGLVPYVTVLESERRAFDAASTTLSIYKERMQNRIALYLALGGDFLLPQDQTPGKTTSSRQELDHDN